MLPGFVVHHTLVELGRLRVLALLAFVRVVALPRHDVIRDLIRRLGGVGPERVLEAVGCVRRVARVVRVAAQGAVEVEALVLPGHEGAVDGDLVQIHTDAVVLRIAVEEHAELEECVGGVLDTWDHTAGGKGGLFYITVIVLRVLVEHQAAELVHLRQSVLKGMSLKSVNVPGIDHAARLSLHQRDRTLASRHLLPQVA